MSVISRRIRLVRTIAEAERLAGVERGAIRSDRRSRGVVRIRQLCMLFGIRRLGMGYTEIGRAMRRDHSSVMWGVRAARQFVGDEPWAAIWAALVAADEERRPPPAPRPPAAPPAAAREPEDVWPDRAWYERQNQAFVAAMRQAHPEREVALGGEL